MDRGWTAESWDLHASGCTEDMYVQQIELRSPIHAAFDQFQSVDCSLDESLIPRQTQACLVSLQPFGKVDQLGNRTLRDLSQPSRQLLLADGNSVDWS